MPIKVQLIALQETIGLFNMYSFKSPTLLMFFNEFVHPDGPSIKLFSIPTCHNEKNKPRANNNSTNKK